MGDRQVTRGISAGACRISSERRGAIDQSHARIWRGQRRARGGAFQQTRKRVDAALSLHRPSRGTTLYARHGRRQFPEPWKTASHQWALPALLCFSTQWLPSIPGASINLPSGYVHAACGCGLTAAKRLTSVHCDSRETRRPHCSKTARGRNDRDEVFPSFGWHAHDGCRALPARMGRVRDRRWEERSAVEPAALPHRRRRLDISANLGKPEVNPPPLLSAARRAVVSPPRGRYCWRWRRSRAVPSHRLQSIQPDMIGA